MQYTQIPISKRSSSGFPKYIHTKKPSLNFKFLPIHDEYTILTFHVKKSGLGVLSRLVILDNALSKNKSSGEMVFFPLICPLEKWTLFLKKALQKKSIITQYPNLFAHLIKLKKLPSPLHIIHAIDFHDEEVIKIEPAKENHNQMSDGNIYILSCDFLAAGRNGLDDETLNLISTLLRLTAQERMTKLTSLFNSLEAIKDTNTSALLRFAEQAGLLFPNMISNILMEQPANDPSYRKYVYDYLKFLLIVMIECEKAFIMAGEEINKRLIFSELSTYYSDFCKYSTEFLTSALAEKMSREKIVFNALSACTSSLC